MTGETGLVVVGPELGHEAVDVRGDLGDFPRAAVGFARILDTGGAELAFDDGVVVFSEKVGDGAGEVGAIGFGAGPVADDAFSQGGEEGHGVVAAAVAELVSHARRPAGSAGLVAVEVEKLKAGPDQVAEMGAGFVDDVVEVELDGGAVEFVTFEADGLPLGGLDELALGCVAEAVDDPLTCRGGPVEPAIG